jgi:hypothetical protein
VIDVTKHEQAAALAERCAKAYSYLGALLGFRPRCTLVVLSRADWAERASNPLYTEEPDRAPLFETLPRVALEHGLLKPVACDLRFFEAFYPDIEPLTYVWYQFRFTMMAKSLIDAAGPGVLRRLWDAFALSDEQLADVLGDRVHPAAGRWPAQWGELYAEG